MSSDRIEEQMKAREERGERRALTTNTLIKIPRAVHFHYFWTAVGKGTLRVLLPWSAFRRFLLLRSPTSCTVSYSRDKLRSIFDIMRVKWVKIPFATRFY